MPACFPEQLLHRGVISARPRATAVATTGESGVWAPQARASSSTPILASSPRTTSRCRYSLEWDAQARASSSSVKPKRSAAPSLTSGSAWNGLAAERHQVTRSGSREAASSRPRASSTAADTGWTDSTSPPRVASTRSSGRDMAPERYRRGTPERRTAPIRRADYIWDARRSHSTKGWTMRVTPTPPPIARDRLGQPLGRVKSRRGGGGGGGVVERYLVGETDRLSPEAPVPVVTIRETRSALGGAANVGANVAAIGAVCRLVGAVGDDGHATAIRAELAAQQMDDRHLVPVPGRPTTAKTRVLARGQQVVRIDEEVETPLEGQDQERVISAAVSALVDADAVVLEDYNKGTLTEALIQAVIAAAPRRGLPVVVDPKFRNLGSTTDRKSTRVNSSHY